MVDDARKFDKEFGTIPFDITKGLPEAQIGAAPDRATLEHNAGMYSMTHDVLHWLVADSKAFNAFYSYVSRNLPKGFPYPPPIDIVRNNIRELHKAFDHITQLFVEMGVLGDDEDL